jgi:hypothetical protein
MTNEFSNIEALSDLLRDSVEKIADDFDEHEDDIVPVLSLVPESGENVMLALDYQWMENEQTKDRLVSSVMIPAITGVGAKTVGTVFSVWMAAPDEGQDPGDMPRPSEHPNRKEAVLVTVMDSFNVRTWFIPINRPDGEIPTLGDWEELPMNAFSGRFVEDVQAALRDSSGQTDPKFMELLTEQAVDLDDLED